VTAPREPAGTENQDGRLLYQCCGDTGGTPRIRHVENAEGELVAEEYACPHCGAYQGRRDMDALGADPHRKRRAELLEGDA